MHTVPYTEIEDAGVEDVGKVALYYLGGVTLAIADTLSECIADADSGLGDAIDRDKIDDHTDHRYLVCGDLVAVEIGPDED